MRKPIAIIPQIFMYLYIALTRINAVILKQAKMATVIRNVRGVCGQQAKVKEVDICLTRKVSSSVPFAVNCRIR